MRRILALASLLAAGAVALAQSNPPPILNYVAVDGGGSQAVGPLYGSETCAVLNLAGLTPGVDGGSFELTLGQVDPLNPNVPIGPVQSAGPFTSPTDAGVTLCYNTLDAGTSACVVSWSVGGFDPIWTGVTLSVVSGEAAIPGPAGPTGPTGATGATGPDTVGGCVTYPNSARICDSPGDLSLIGQTGLAEATFSSSGGWVDGGLSVGSLVADTVSAQASITAPLITVPSVNGTIWSTVLSPPAAPSVSVTGTSGTTSYSYCVSALTSTTYIGGSETTCSAAGTTAVGNATLSATNYSQITWSAVTGAYSYNVYRTASSGTPATTGLIGNVLATATLQLDDTGLSTQANFTTGATAYGSPGQNLSGRLVVSGDSAAGYAGLCFSPMTNSGNWSGCKYGIRVGDPYIAIDGTLITGGIVTQGNIIDVSQFSGEFLQLAASTITANATLICYNPGSTNYFLNTAGLTLAVSNTDCGAGSNFRIQDITGLAASAPDTITAPAGQTIDGLASIQISTDWGEVEIYDDAAGNWHSNRASGGFGAGGIYTSSSIKGSGLVSVALATPAAPTITNVGTAGTTTYYYCLTSVDGAGEGVCGAAGSTATGNATLSATNYNVVTAPALPSGASTMNAYVCTTSACTTTNQLCTGLVSGGTCDDTGTRTGGSAPAADETATITTAGTIIANGGNNTNSYPSIFAHEGILNDGWLWQQQIAYFNGNSGQVAIGGATYPFTVGFPDYLYVTTTSVGTTTGPLFLTGASGTQIGNATGDNPIKHVHVIAVYLPATSVSATSTISVDLATSTACPSSNAACTSQCTCTSAGCCGLATTSGLDYTQLASSTANAYAGLTPYDTCSLGGLFNISSNAALGFSCIGGNGALNLEVHINNPTASTITTNAGVMTLELHSH